MKGIILCGGMGTRLLPLTKVTNKCLLPIYNKPMIYWPLQTLVESGVKDILLVCGGNSASEFLRILGDGSDLGIKSLYYAFQKEAKGIANALALGENFAKNEPVAVILGDNLFQTPIPEIVAEFESNPEGAKIFLTESTHPENYGVAEVDTTTGYVLGIEEKPKEPKSNLIATGMYLYDKNVWDYIRTLKPSKRNELEITDLNNRYLSIGKLKANRINGWWSDCGESLDGYTQVCYKASQLEKNNV